jgi:hypothetical protein
MADFSDLWRPCPIGWNDTCQRIKSGFRRENQQIPREGIVCRNIKILFNFEPPVTDDEVRAAALQFVRKISGFTKPSQANEAAFYGAVDEIKDVANRLLHSLETNAAPKNREEEAAKAKARSVQRFG